MIIAPVQEHHEITQPFGVNKDDYAQFNMEGHNGQDIGVPVGTPVYAPIDGIAWQWNDEKGYGKCTFITGPAERNGVRRQVVLGHFSEHKHNQNKFVKQGDQIALSGDTGNSSGPHLHWGMRQVIVYRNGQIYYKNDFNEVGGVSFSVVNYDNGFFGYFDIFEKGWIISHGVSKF